MCIGRRIFGRYVIQRLKDGSTLMFKKVVFLLIAIIVVNGCREKVKVLRLATTTSMQNSGLLDFILPPFERAHNLKVHVIAVGTGAALKLGENGDVDAMIVHAKDMEEKFVAQGFGINRVEFVYNEFVIVGPPNDPAGIKELNFVVEAFRKIRDVGILFISRVDNSGTHQKELAIWSEAGIVSAGDWYVESGQGMGETLLMAHEKQGYTLTDNATFWAIKERLALDIVLLSDERLHNVYSIITPNPSRFSHVNVQGAEALTEWLLSPTCQSMIENFKENGRRLFHPLVVK